MAQTDAAVEEPSCRRPVSDRHGRTSPASKLKPPDGTVKGLVEGLHRGRVLTIEDTGGLFVSHIEAVVEEDTGGNTDLEAVRRTLLAQFEQYAKLNKKSPPKLSAALTALPKTAG